MAIGVRGEAVKDVSAAKNNYEIYSKKDADGLNIVACAARDGNVELISHILQIAQANDRMGKHVRALSEKFEGKHFGVDEMIDLMLARDSAGKISTPNLPGDVMSKIFNTPQRQEKLAEANKEILPALEDEFEEALSGMASKFLESVKLANCFSGWKDFAKKSQGSRSESSGSTVLGSPDSGNRKCIQNNKDTIVYTKSI